MRASTLAQVGVYPAYGRAVTEASRAAGRGGSSIDGPRERAVAGSHSTRRAGGAPRRLALMLALLLLTLVSMPALAQNLIVTYGGTGIQGYSGDGGPAIFSALYAPQRVVVDAAGNLYIADTSNHRIRKISTTGVITTFAGNGTADYAGDGDQAIYAHLSSPTGLAFDSAGNLYIADTNNHRIRQVSTTGRMSTVAGTGTAGFAGDGAAATFAKLNAPAGVAVDSAGNIYIADQNNHRIRKVDGSGNISTFAGTGSTVFGGDGGQAASATLYYPSAVRLDATGNLYIADYYNHRIRKVTTDGVINTVAGTGSAGTSGDGGQATAARLYYPTDIALDASGNLYIGDLYSYKVRMVNGSGVISTIAGTGASSDTGDGNPATSATLPGETGLAVDSSGNVYIADHNTRVRRVQAPTSSNPVPALTAASPSSAYVGNAAFTLNVYGAGFVPGAIIRWNGNDRSTTFISGNWLRTSISASDIAATGTASVTVFNPTANGGGGASSALSFAILAQPAPRTALMTTFAGNGISGYSGDGGPAVYSSVGGPQGLALDNSGNLYISENSNRVRKVNTSGIISTFAGGGSNGLLDGGPARFAQVNNPGGLAFDSAGNLYIADLGNHRIRKVTTGGIITTVAGNGVAGFSGDGGPAVNAKLYNPQDVAVDAAGNLYIADESNHRIRKVDVNGNISTFAGNGIGGFFGDGGPAANSPLYNPVGVAVDSAGNLYIADWSNYRVRKVAPDGTISTVAGNGSGGSSGDGGPANAARLYLPYLIRLDTAGNLYIPDYYNSRVRIVSPGGMINTIAGGGSGPDGSLATGTALSYPYGVAIDQAGNVYVSDSNNNRVRRVQAPVSNNAAPTVTSMYPASALAGGTDFTLTVYGTSFAPGAVVRWNGADRVTTYISSTQLTAAMRAADVAGAGTMPVLVFNPAPGGGASNALNFTISAPTAPTALMVTAVGSGYAGYSGDGAPGLFTALNSPYGVALDAVGNLYVSENGNNRVRKISTSGVVSTFAGGGSSLGDGGPATSAQLSGPVGITLDSAGNLYIADDGNHRIRKVTPGGTITTVAGTGTAGFAGDGGPAVNAQLYGPHDVAIDALGNLYIADYSNHRIRKVDTSGNISTFAGNGIAGYYGDGGPATTTTLYSPVGVAVDVNGNVYIADWSNQRVRKVALDGTISTVAGNGSGGFSGDGGPANAARIYGPYLIRLDTSGNLYIPDYYNNRVRLVTPGGIINTIAGGGTGTDGGLATTDALHYPAGIAIDPAGNIYIGDSGSDRIRRVQAPTSNNPVPVLSSLLPSAMLVNSGDTTIRVNGANFVPGATVRWNDSDRLTTYISSQQLGVLFRFYDFVGSGVSQITVFNPTLGGGGGVSNSLNFAVLASYPVPTAVITTKAGTGTAGFSGDNGLATSAKIYDPYAVLAANGSLYIADYSNGRVRKVDASGVITTIAGGGSSLGDGGPATQAQVSPTALAMDSAGNLYIADNDRHRVRKVTPAGVITTVAGNGTAAYGGDGGPATAARLYYPQGLAIDSADNLYIADTYNHRIRKVTADGNIVTVAGNGITGYFGDGGPATASPLYYPRGLAFDNVGNLYIADHSNHRIRKVLADGSIATIAGTGSTSFNGDGGAAIASGLNGPWGVAVDAGGNVFIADYYHHRVRKVDPSGMIITVAGNGSASYSGDGSAAVNAGVYYPIGLALDPDGNLYIAETGSDRIRMVAAAGVPQPSCQYLIGSFTTTVDANAGNGSITLAATTGCSWTASSSAAWLSITSGTAGTGSGVVNYGVAANAALTPRSGIITLGGTNGLTFTVNQSGINPVPVISTLSPPSISAGSAAFTLTVTGSGFASSSIVRWNGSARTTIYVSDTQLNAAIPVSDVTAASAAPVTVFSPTPGGGTSNAVTFAVNAVIPPAITSLSPATVLVGSGALTLTVNGANFVNGSIVRWNGATRVTVFVSATQLTAAITTADAASAGTAQVTVVNPPPGGTSVAAPFIVDPGTPTVVTLAPAGVNAGSSSFLLTVTGANFVNGSTVRWNGTPVTTIYVGATQLAAAIGTAGVATAGTVQVTVANPSGGTSNALSFAIMAVNPVPVVSAISPVKATAGGAAFTLTVDGANFTSNSSVQWNGYARTTLFVSGTQLTAAITAADIAAQGTAQVTVVNPAPGGGTSSPAGFTIDSNAAASGTLTAGATQGNPGATATIQLALTLNSGVNIDGLLFGLSITPAGSAPALTGNVFFTPGNALGTPSVSDTNAGPGALSVSWLLLPSALTGNIAVGQVGVNIPPTAQTNQTYTIHLTAANASSGSNEVKLATGGDATLTVARPYLLGDTFPVPSTSGDLNSDGTYNDAGEFGDGSLTILDLIQTLRAVTGMPGATPPSCSDRFDAMDAYPVDTGSTRGGDGALNIIDLIISLRRTTGVDPVRPTRSPRGLVCTASMGAAPALQGLKAQSEPTAGGLEFGDAETGMSGAIRIPVYLSARTRLLLSGLAFSVGLRAEYQGPTEPRLKSAAADEKERFLPPGADPQLPVRLRFTAADQPPSLLDQALGNSIAAAWLDGLMVEAGQRRLVGYIELEAQQQLDASCLIVYGLDAAARADGAIVPLSKPHSASGKAEK